MRLTWVRHLVLVSTKSKRLWAKPPWLVSPGLLREANHLTMKGSVMVSLSPRFDEIVVWVHYCKVPIVNLCRALEMGKRAGVSCSTVSETDGAHFWPLQPPLPFGQESIAANLSWCLASVFIDLPLSGGEWCLSDRVAQRGKAAAAAKDAQPLPGQTEGMSHCLSVWETSKWCCQWHAAARAQGSGLRAQGNRNDETFVSLVARYHCHFADCRRRVAVCCTSPSLVS